ncbi:MAG TPA: protein kinase [Gemmatimonadaceae bacterium]
MPPPSERLSRALSDRYRIERELGVGGMATVFLAHDLRHDRQVAIKVLHEDLGATLGPERFLAEIKTTARLQHPHILPLLDSGAADGLLYYVMPVVAGESLRERLRRDRLLPLDDALRIVREVADALGYAHAHGVIHRDIKPENILLHGGHALVTDFGIALAVEQAGGTRMTQTGLSLGTPQYMSPEQAMGERSIDGRSDIYSLAVVTYEMLTGETPFTGATVQAIVAKVLSDRPRPVTMLRDTVPPHVEGAVLKALAKLPADRPADAAAFATALASPGPEPSVATGAARAPEDARSVRRWQIATAVLSASTVVLALLAVRGDRDAAPGIIRAEVDIGLTSVLTVPALATSPDGRSIVYCSGNEVWLRRWEDFSATRVRSGDSGCATAAFSPDGQQLAIIGVPNSLRVVSLVGQAPPRMVPVAGLPDIPVYGGGVEWGSDGVIYIASRDVLLGVRPDGVTDTVAHMDSTLALQALDVLPDAQASLVVLAPRASTELEEHRIALVDHRSGSTSVILQGVNARLAGDEYLLMVRGDGLMAAVPFDLRRRRLTGEPVVLGDSIRPDLPLFDVTREGTLVYWRSGETGMARPVLVDRRGVFKELPPTWEEVFLTPRVSPDGTRFVVEAFRAGASVVWLRDLRSGQTTRLTSAGTTGSRPTWYPNGRSLVILADEGGVLRSYRRSLDAATMTPMRLYDARGVFQVEWSHDGAWLIMRTDDQAAGKGDILAVRPGVDTVAVPVAASADYAEYSPSLSPDGRWMAYVSNQSGRYEVWVSSFPDGRERWQVSSGGGTEPLWSRSGEELFYLLDGYLVSSAVTTTPEFRASPPERLFSVAPYFDYGEFNRNYDVLPGDTTFLMLRKNDEGTTRLVAVLNWRAQLDR